MTNIILDGDQLEAKEKLHAWLATPPKEAGNYFRLRGTAGSGKTTLLKEACKILDPSTTALVAPTHKALTICSKGAHFAATKATLTSLLGLKPKKDKDKTVLTRRAKFDTAELFAHRTIVIDEADMVDEGHWKFIREAVKMTDWRVILSGDPCQLPPVNEIDSTCSQMILPESAQAELTKTRRFGDGVLTFANSIRDKITRRSEDIAWDDSIGEDGSGVRFLSEKDFQKEVKRCLLETRESGNPDHCKIISYTNKKAIDFDRRAAKVLGYSPETGFNAGDRVTVKSAFSQGDQLVLSTGEDLKVMSSFPSDHPEFPFLKGQTLVVQRDDKTNVTVQTLAPSSRLDYNGLVDEFLNEGRTLGEWFRFHELTSFYADIRYGVGLTVHESQGSTFDNVFCDLTSIFPSRRYRPPAWDEVLAERLLYTAVTRGKNVFMF